MSKTVHKFTQYTLLFVLFHQKWLVLTEQSIHGMVSTDIMMSSHARITNMQMCSDNSKSVLTSPNGRKTVHKFTQYTHYLVMLQKITCLTIHGMVSTHYDVLFTNSHSTLIFVCFKKNYLSWLNNLFLVWFELIMISTYAKVKLQMCSDTQHQCRRRQMCGKLFTNSYSTLTFCLLQKSDLSWLYTIYWWDMVSTHYDVLLC